MRKRIKGRKIGRQKDQRTALMRTLLVSLIKEKRIETTLPKAKELRSFAERKITIAKRGLKGDDLTKLAKLRLLKKDLPDQKIVNELFKIADFFQEREGGYTRILKLMPRKSDAAERAILEWTEREKMIEKGEKKKKKEDKADAKNVKEGSALKEKKEEETKKKSVESKKEGPDKSNHKDSKEA
ncbi:MAG: 50S ribosomal protein L17 [Patescibacteria group bacterium]